MTHNTVGADISFGMVAVGYIVSRASITCRLHGRDVRLVILVMNVVFKRFKRTYGLFNVGRIRVGEIAKNQCFLVVCVVLHFFYSYFRRTYSPVFVALTPKITMLFSPRNFPVLYLHICEPTYLNDV